MAMQFESAFYARKEQRVVREPAAEARRSIARGIIYDDLPIAAVRKRVEAVKNDPEIGTLLHLAEGVEAHEQANGVFLGEWQKTLAAQEQPEMLSRKEVAALFERLPGRESLLQAEQRALTHYESLLKVGGDVEISLSDRIQLKRADIEVLVNDLRLRMAERGADDDVRKETIRELDAELAEMIEGMSIEDTGKRFELEEIYLLRRLVHEGDMGHLISVEHSTPREDLRADRGSVDIQVAVAGDALPFQLKTFRRATNTEIHLQQKMVHTRAVEQLRGSKTHIVVLEAESVGEAYRSALRQPKNRRTSVADKYAALRPLTEVLLPDERRRLLTLTGMTEEGLTREEEERQARYVAFRENQATYFLREAERLRPFREAEEKKRQAREAEEQRQAEVARVAAERIRERAAAVNEKQQSAVIHAQESLVQAKVRREAEAVRAAEEAQKMAVKLAARESRRRAFLERQEAGWPPKEFLGLLDTSLLQKLQFLPEHWKNDAAQLLAAKKEFLRLFTQLKKGASPMEKDKPNALFKSLFPSSAALASPSEETLERVHGMPESKAA